MNDRVLAVAGLVKSFDGVHAVRGVSFDVAAGELVALIGPNGAGKTTCFNCINGQLVPDKGTVTLAGVDITGRSPRDARRARSRSPGSAARSRSPRRSPR